MGKERPSSSASQTKAGKAVLAPFFFALLVLAAGCGRNEPSATKTPGPDAILATGAGCVFVDATEQTRLAFRHQLADGEMDNIMESDGAGGTVLDFDNDGWLDVYLVNSGPAPVLSDAPPGTPRQPNRLFHNRGDGTFEDVTEKSGVAGYGFGTTAAAADYDNDGYADLLVVNFGGLILYHNNGNGTFAEVTDKAGLSSKRAGISATFFDADNDGWLDIMVANYLVYDPAVKVPPGTAAPYPSPLAYKAELNILYRNRGDGTFEDVSKASGMEIPGHRAMSVAPFDYDGDGDTDLYISNDATPNLLLENDGKGHFKEVAMQRGVAVNQFGEAGGSMGAAMGDCNGDGRPDVFVTRFGNASLYLNSKSSNFDDRIQNSGLLEPTGRFTGWGGCFGDFDNDGDLDLFVVNGNAHFLRGMPPLFLENQGNGTFSNGSENAGPLFKRELNGRGLLVADFRNNGHLDAVIHVLGGPAVVAQNRTTNLNHWLKLRLEGTRSNRDGFGARVRLTTAGKTQFAEARCPTTYVSQHDCRLHFGMGAGRVAESLEIIWPSGARQLLTNVVSDQILQVREPGESRWPLKR